MGTSLGQTGPIPGTNRTRPRDKPAVFCLIPKQNRHFVPFVLGTGSGLSLGTIVPQGPSEMFMCFLFSGFFAPNQCDGKSVSILFRDGKVLVLSVYVSEIAEDMHVLHT